MRILLIIALASQLLVPIYSDFNFFSLGIGYILNNKNWIFSWYPSSPGYGIILDKIVSNLGGNPLIIIDLILKSTIIFLLPKIVNNEKSSLIFFTSLLTGISLFYGKDLSPLSVFILIVLIQFKYLFSNSSINFIQVINLTALTYLGVLIDDRIIISPLFALLLSSSLEEPIKKNSKILVLSLQLTSLILFMLNNRIYNGVSSSLLNFYSYLNLCLKNKEIISLPLGSHIPDLSYSSSCIILIFILSIIRKYSAKNIVIVISLGMLSFISEMFFSIFPIFIFFTFSSSKIKNKYYLRLEFLADEISNFFKKYFTLKAKSFFLIAFIYFQLAPLMKLPITDLLMPASEVDKILEEKNCITINNLVYGGYFFYRYSVISYNSDPNQIRCEEIKHYNNLYITNYSSEN